MTASLHDIFDDLADRAPAYSELWAVRARSQARRRARQVRAAGSVTIVVALLAALAVVVVPDRQRKTLPATGPGLLPSRIDAPRTPPRSVLQSPMRKAAALASGPTGLFLVDADGGPPRGMPYSVADGQPGGVVTYAPGQGCGPTLSTDGTQLAWLVCSVSAGGTGRLMLLTLSTGSVSAVTVPGIRNPVGPIAMSWAPDGSAVVVGDERSVQLVDVATRSARAVRGPGPSPRFAWSPDSQHFVVTPFGSATKFEADVDTRNGTRVRHLSVLAPTPGGAGGYNSSVQWSPDADSLALVLTTPGGTSYLRVPVDGSPAAVTPVRGDYVNPNRTGSALRGFRDGLPVVELGSLMLVRVAAESSSRAPSWGTYDMRVGKFGSLVEPGPGVYLVQVAGDVLAHAKRVHVTTPEFTPRPTPRPSPSPTPPITALPSDWSSRVTALGVTLASPPGWRADPVQARPPRQLWTSVCVHAPGTRASVQCRGGMLIERITAEQGRAWQGTVQVDAMGSGPGTCDPYRETGSSGGGEEQIDSSRTSVSVTQCSGNHDLVRWALRDLTAVLQADVSVPATVAAVRSARVADIGGPTASNVTLQSAQLMVRVPLSWGSFYRGAECLFPQSNEQMACPLDSLLFREPQFFRGGKQKATPAPTTALGYIPWTPARSQLDVATGCDAFAGLQYTTEPTAGGVQRRLLRQTRTTVAGHAATYYEWAASCPSGQAFTWRRWWLPQDTLMIDSYDTTDAPNASVIDDLLANDVTWLTK